MLVILTNWSKVRILPEAPLILFMKNIPRQFTAALKKILSSESKESKRLAEKLENDPDKSAELIAHHLGSATQPIKFK